MAEAAIFDKTYKGYRVRAHYLPKTLKDSDHALVCITHQGALRRLILYPAYRVWNVAAHFADWVEEMD